MILLLTACINPNGMAYTALSNKEERESQYVNAIKFYLSNTHYPIVFTENSGTDISHFFTDYIKSGRMECLSFQGNHNKDRGKGYGECEIIHYAINNSKTIHSNPKQRIAKITGRLIIRNIKTIIRWHTFLTSNQTTLCSFNSDLSFPDSRFIIAPKEFYQVFLRNKNFINDSAGYYFEHALCYTLKTERRYSYRPYFIKPEIIGISGSSGELYNDRALNFRSAIRYAHYALYLCHKFHREFRN